MFLCFFLCRFKVLNTKYLKIQQLPGPPRLSGKFHRNVSPLHVFCVKISLWQNKEQLDRHEELPLPPLGPWNTFQRNISIFFFLTCIFVLQSRYKNYVKLSEDLFFQPRAVHGCYYTAPCRFVSFSKRSSVSCSAAIQSRNRSLENGEWTNEMTLKFCQWHSARTLHWWLTLNLKITVLHTCLHTRLVLS